MTPSDMYNGMRVIPVLQNKGGVGKTFITTNLAVRANMGAIPEVTKRVLLMDVDLQQNLSSTFLDMQELPGKESKLPPLHPEYDPDDPEDRDWGGRSSSFSVYYGEAVLPYPTQLDRVDILPADGSVLTDFHSAMQEATDAALVNALQNRLFKFFSLPDVQKLYDLILIDCPPGKGLIHMPILRAATDVIIPCEPQPHCVDGTTQTVNLIHGENKNRRNAPSINIAGVIPNKYDVRSKDYQNNLYAMRQNNIWGHEVPDFELRLLKDYRISHLPEEVGSLMHYSTKRAEHGMQQFINHFRNRVYGTAMSAEQLGRTG